MEYKQVRQKYPNFVYHTYKIEEDEQNIYLIYHFEIEGLTSFHPVLTILKKNFRWHDLHRSVGAKYCF